MKKMNRLHLLSYVLWLEFRRILLGIKYIAEVDVTDNCNLRCKHCYHFHGKKTFVENEVPIQIWDERFRELHSSGIRLILLVGGEPAIRNDVLMLADNIFPFVSVITNGTIKIPGEFNNRLFVSMDGSRKTNDSIRGDGVFSKIIKNYTGDRRVVINMTLMKENYKELGEVIKIAKKHGFMGVVCNIYTPGIDFKGSMFLKSEDRRRIMSEVKRLKSVYPKDFLLSKAMIRWYENPDHSDYCYWGDEALHFDVSWNKRRCFAKADCSNCGCLAGSLQNPLKMLFYPREASRIALSD